MDIKQLEVFNTICKHKNFSSAAKELFISQPTVSSHIKSLEENLGLQLFNRKNKAMGNLTDAGKILYQYSTQILSLVHEAEASLDHYKQGNFGALSLATSHTFCNWFLPNILESFKQKYPSVEIVLHTDFTPKMVNMVENREVHFAIARTNSPTYTDNDLHSELIGQDPSVLVVSPQHHLADSKKVTIDEIIKEQFIVFGKKSSYWPQINNLFANEGHELKTSMELNDINAVKKMIEINMGIAILPLISIQDELEKGTLITISVKGFPQMIRYSHLVYQKDLIITGPIENFLQFIQETKPFSL
ncbi:LysR family transcriptional regulator [Peribacillus cavernae]|uniref:LysR family transcriptional regulator n=1 Tax=Peribacillus cavernae TaxID=1674310 RepID=A0A3S0W3U0_9BACI|nr:LysR family transcriptional regulator [Peribacillus cavernae]MDQ0219506.1 DNA-binding transcriptional LysR family regulator [Peribacillus cavernae]RUQ27078.1 LysR family transcriptional regulator [Peribacillus cavernae]